MTLKQAWMGNDFNFCVCSFELQNIIFRCHASKDFRFAYSTLPQIFYSVIFTYLIIIYHFAVGLCLKVSIAVVLDCLKVYKRIYSFRALSIIKQVHGSPKLGPPLSDQYRTNWKVYKKRWVKWNKYYELIVGKQNGDERKPVPPYITLTK